MREILLIPCGSRIYGTASKSSDCDYMAIVDDDLLEDKATGFEFFKKNINLQFYTYTDFQKHLDEHKVHALEGYFLPESLIKDNFHFELDLTILRSSFSEKASNSFVKAKKKIEVEKDFYIGWKSLFHSLRILDFGSQIAEKGYIEDYASASHFWLEIVGEQQYNWKFFKEKYQPIYNRLATRFRELAPKSLDLVTT